MTRFSEEKRPKLSKLWAKPKGNEKHSVKSHILKIFNFLFLIFIINEHKV